MELAQLITNMFTPQGFGNLLGWLIIILQAVYLLFAFITTRQVAIMNKSFATDAAWVFRTIARIQFIVALAILVISIIII